MYLESILFGMSLLPGQLLPQSVPFGKVAENGLFYVDQNWYLFFYNIALKTLATQNSGQLPTSEGDLVDMVDLDALGCDLPALLRHIQNIDALLPVEPLFSNLREITNAYLLATDGLLEDSDSIARPVQTVTVGASPFTYTALSNGSVSISGGAVSAVSVIRQGVSVASGITSGMIPVRFGDGVQVTYTTAPTMVFLPD